MVVWQKSRLLIVRHGVLVPMIALGLINQNWLLTGGGRQDPWKMFESFTNFGSLSPESQASYKSTRSIFVLCGQILIWFLGNYWGQVGLAAINLIAMYLAIRYLLVTIYGKVHPLAIAIVLYLPSLHGVGGWMYGISFSFPLVVVSLAFAIKLFDMPDESSNRGTVPRIGVLLGLSCTLIWFIHPAALPALVSALLSAQVFFAVLTKRYKVIRSSMTGFVFGGILAALIGELSGFAIGLRKSVTLSAVNWYIFLAKEENVSAFRKPLTSWLADATYLAPIGMGLSLAIGVLLKRRRFVGYDGAVSRKSSVLIGMCFTAITFLVLYEIREGSLLSFDYYASILMLFAGLLAAGSLQFLLENLSDRATPPNGLELPVLIAIALIMVGWQIAEQPISRPGTILTAVLVWCVLGGILGVGSTKSGFARATVWCFGTLMFGVLSGEPQYVVASCQTREIETRTILSFVRLAESGYFQDRVGPVFVIDAPSYSTSECKPSTSSIRSSVGDQIPPFQVASSLQLNAIQRPNASTLVLGSNDRAVRQELHVAQTVPGLKDILVARPVPNIYGVTALEVFHRDLTELIRVLKPLVEGSGRPIAEWVEEVLKNETYLTLNQLVRDKPESRTVLIATSENDVFEALFPKVVGRFTVKSESTANDTETTGVCEALSESRAEGIVVGLGVTQDALSLDRLARAKKVVQDCLARLGWRYVAEPDNSESPLVIHILDN